METQQVLQPVRQKVSAGFFFLSLGLLITLITSVTSFLNLVFETLNKRFPDVLNSSYQYGYSVYDYEGMRFALATLIIFFPVFLIVSRFWKKYGRGVIGAGDEIVRRWVIYVILFLSSIVAAVDLVALIRYFISGEVTTRFILKVTAVLIVALYVGFYFIFELKKKEKVFGVGIGLSASIKSSALVLLVIIWSFTVMGSPFKQRQLRLDDRRVNDLMNMQYQVINYWQQKEKLPEKLSDLANPLSGYSLPVDPEFEKGMAYEYAVKDAKKLTFELCAAFSLPMPKGWREYSGGRTVPMMGYPEKDVAVSYPYPGGGVNESWDHEAGRTCFERTIDKDMYPPYPKPAR